MNKVILSFVIVLASMLSPLTAVSQADGRVLLLARESTTHMEYVLIHEVIPMVTMLSAAGYQVDVATPTGSVIEAGTARLVAQLRYSDVDLRRYIGVVVPCMGEDFDMPERRLASAIVWQAARTGMPIAAQMGGVVILADAGVLDGKEFAIRADRVGYVPNGIYKGTGVVRDGNIVTSGICPYTLVEQRGKYTQDGTKELIDQFVQVLLSTAKT